jgi:hypothetical protein
MATIIKYPGLFAVATSHQEGNVAASRGRFHERLQQKTRSVKLLMRFFFIGSTASFRLIPSIGRPKKIYRTRCN